jgi:hypothetical protein
MHSNGPWTETKPESRKHTPIPAPLKDLAFNQLADLIDATLDEDGARLVQAQRERIARAACGACVRHSATATLRVWLARHQEKDR